MHCGDFNFTKLRSPSNDSEEQTRDVDDLEMMNPMLNLNNTRTNFISKKIENVFFRPISSAAFPIPRRRSKIIINEDTILGSVDGSRTTQVVSWHKSKEIASRLASMCDTFDKEFFGDAYANRLTVDFDQNQTNFNSPSWWSRLRFFLLAF